MTKLRLRDRDRQIMKAVNDYQALQIQHLQALFFGSKSPAYKRVGQLAEHGFLKVHYVSQVATAPAASARVFTIGQAGAQVLIDTFEYTRDDLNFASRQVTNYVTLQHLLKVNDVRVAITCAASDIPDFELVEWRNETVFRSRPDHVLIKKKGQGKRKPVLPDGYCLIRTPGGYAHCFIEVDRGRENQRQFANQIEIYQAYMESGLYQKQFKTTSLRILVITTSQRRLENLMNAAKRVGANDRYWFSTFEQVTPQTVLTEAIWYKPDKQHSHRFYDLNT